MKTITAADYFVEFLIANGVTDVFGYQGGMIAYIFDSLGKYRNEISYHSCGNEQGAALAACAYAQASGKLGVAITTSGPGFTNLVSGIANAWFDSIPVLFLSGQVNTKDKKRDRPFRQLGFQEIQATKIAETITKKVYDVEMDTDIPQCLNDAYLTAMSERKGPVYLDFPINICREVLTVDDVTPVSLTKTPPIKADAILTDLKKAQRPAIIAGAGILQAGLRDDFRQMVEFLGLPVVHTMPASAVLPGDSPYRMGYIGGTARREAGLILEHADYVLTLGTRLCSKQIGHNLSLFAPKAKKIVRVDLDTTEFERKVKDDEVQIAADLRAVIPGLLFALQDTHYTPCHQVWLDTCARVKALLNCCDITQGNEIFERISKELPEDANLVMDVGKNLIYGTQSAVIKKQTRFFLSAGLGTMGYSIPASIGAYYGNGCPTFSFNGDGGAQMNIQELNTIAKNKLPIKIFVLNNNALGNIVMFQKQYLGNRIVATSEAEGDYFSCNFQRIAEAYGIRSYRISADEITEYREQLLDDQPTLFELIYEDCECLPSIVAGGDFIGGGPKLPDCVINELNTLLMGCE